MKILHTSDWHLGKFVMLQSMLDDQRYFIENVFLRALDEYAPDVIVLAGDIYDRSIAPTDAIKLWEDTLYAVAERGIPMIAVSGNHDSAERIMPAARLMRQAGICLANTVTDFFDPIDLTAKDGSRARFFPLPFFDLPTAKAVTDSDTLCDVNEAYGALLAMNQEKLAGDCPNILITHCTVTGAVTCDSESRIFVGGAQQVSSRLFDAFDFVCLGHIHSPQKAGGNAMYSGSPLRYSFDKNERDKQMLLIDTNDGMSVTRIPIQPRRDMRTLSGSFEELMSVPDNSTQDYIFAVITDDRLVYEPMTRLREKYPHILGIDQQAMHRTTAGNADRDTLREQMSNHTITDEQVMTLFLQDICQCEPQQDDLLLFHKILDEMKGEETA